MTWIKNIGQYLFGVLTTLASILIYSLLSKPTTTINNNNEIKKVKGSSVNMDHTQEGYTDKRTEKTKKRITKADGKGNTKRANRLRNKLR